MWAAGFAPPQHSSWERPPSRSSALATASTSNTLTATYRQPDGFRSTIDGYPWRRGGPRSGSHADGPPSKSTLGERSRWRRPRRARHATVQPTPRGRPYELRRPVVQPRPMRDEPAMQLADPVD